MNYSFLIEQVENFVKTKVNLGSSPELPYHNLKHVEQVVGYVEEIAKYYKLGDRDYFISVAAAWFHDYSGDAAVPEESGIKLSSVFLAELQLDEEIVTAVVNCILSTHIPQSPQNLIEEILCDAESYYLGTDEFYESNKLLRKEMAVISGTEIDKIDWRLHTIAQLESHRYYTDFCRDLLENRKQENLQKLKKKAMKKEMNLPDDLDQRNLAETQQEVLKEEAQRAKAQKEEKFASDKKQKSDRPDKGIETMFRISSGNHQRLSDMADNKANIMITTNSIIISVLLSMLLRKLEDNPYLIVPTLMLLTVCVTTMVFSILATRPSVPHGIFSKEDIDNKSVNLLFFGNFYRMSYEDYAGGMQEMMSDRDFLYGSLTKDVYAQGVVLGKKYKLLRTGYNIFMFGIVFSVVSFVISSMFFGS